MIWIATVCLLAVIAWLFLNALNERRWVEAHSHDEGVAADKGFLPDVSAISARVKADAGARLSLENEDSRFARAVRKVQARGARVADRIERKASEGRERDDADTFFGRMVEKVGGVSKGLDEKLDQRAAREAATESRSITEEDSFLGRATARVSRKQAEYGERVRERMSRNAALDQPPGSADAEGFFGRMVERVSGRLDGIEKKLDDKAAFARGDRAVSTTGTGTGSGAADDKEDFLIRASRRIGARVNEIDEKIVDASKTAVDSVERKTGL